MRGDHAATRRMGRRCRAAVSGLGTALLLAACALPQSPHPLQEPVAAVQVAAAPAPSGLAAANAIGAGVVVPSPDARQIEHTYPGARTYSGVLSCAGCERSRFTVTVFADGRFRLRDEPLDANAGDPAAARSAVSDHGRWHTLSDAANRIVLEGRDGDRLLQRVAPDGLMILDHEGRPLRGLADATLPRQAKVDPLGGPMRLIGHYGFEGSQRVFVECASGRKFPVLATAPSGTAPNPAQAALDAAWQGLQPQPDEPVLAVLQAYLVPRTGERAGPHEEAVVVAGFERATRNGMCASRASNAR